MGAVLFRWQSAVRGFLKSKAGISLCAIVLLLVAAELMLRWGFGFCDALLYRESAAYEYIALPGQNRVRFGAHIHYNSFSQRCEEPDTARHPVLGLGDSVLFGGTWMEQDSLASSLFTRETGVQMLNIACGSWGPDNCAAYLREQGAFGARAMVLVCSSHDAYDTMSHTPVVGVFPNYPDRQYRLALWELLDRYLLPRARALLHTPAPVDPDQAVAQGVAQKSPTFNSGFDELKNMADSLRIPLLVYLHAETGELAAGRYNWMGQQIIGWATRRHVPLMQGIRTEQPSMYHDVIHLNARGQRHLADALEKMIGQRK